MDEPLATLARPALMRVLVTGGAGYVGGASVDTLLGAGHAVVVLDDLSTGHAAAVPAGAKLRTADYTDLGSTRRVLAEERVEAILHCGARSLVGESMVDPARYWRDNVAGGVALLEAARTAGVGRFVFSSSAATYGVPDRTPIEEDDPIRPINTYGETKAAFERALAAYGTSHGIRSVTLRYFNVAGATDRIGECHDPETHLIPNALRAAEGGPPLELFGDDYPTPDGTAIRDYIHVADLADAHLAALEATAPADPRTATPLVCNLGTGSGFSVREVLATAAQIVGREIPHAIAPRRPGDPPILIASPGRAREVLGWAPARSSLREMIGSAWAWRQRNPNGYLGDSGRGAIPARADSDPGAARA